MSARSCRSARSRRSEGSSELAGGAGSPGAGGLPGIGVGGIFGSGDDGSQTTAANTTLTRDTYYGDLIVASGVTLNPGGFRIFVSGQLTLQDGSGISRDGADATSSAPGGLASDPLGVPEATKGHA